MQEQSMRTSQLLQLGFHIYKLVVRLQLIDLNDMLRRRVEGERVDELSVAE